MNFLNATVYRSVVKFAASCVLTMLLATSSHAATFYLSLTTNSPAGSDANSCTAAQTATTPKATMNSILACPALTGGDTVYIRGGTYNQRMDFITAAKNGTSNAQLVIAGYPGETVIWKYTDPVHNDYGGIKAWGNNYLTFRDFAVDGSNYSWGSTDPSTAGTGWSILGSTGIILDNMDISGQPDNGLLITQGSSNIVIRNSRIHDACGLSCYGDVVGHRWYAIYVHDGTNIVIENNDLYNNPGGGMQIYPGPLSGVTVRKNKIHNNSSYATSNVGGIIVGPSTGATFTNIQIYNNLIYNNGSGPQSVAPGIYFYNTVTGVLAINNTIFGNRTQGIFLETSAASSNILQNNLIVGNLGAQILNNGTGTVQTTNRTTGVITDCTVSSADFTQKTGSVCADAGTARTGFLSNGTPDIGAFESFGFSAATVNQNFLDVTLNMSVNTPAVAGATTEWIALNGGVARTTTSVAMLSDSVVRITFNGAACVGGETWTVTHTVGTATDSALIGGTSNQSLSAFTAQAVTNKCGTAPPADPGTPWIYYKLDDNTGTTATDQSANVLNGTLTNGPQWVTGFSNFGVHFTDQVDNTIAIPYGSGVNPFTQPLTVCLAAKPDAGLTGSQRVVFASVNGTNQRFYIGWISSTWGIGVQSSGFATNTEFPATSNWTRLCLVMNSGTATLYVSGVAGTSSQSIKTYSSYTLSSNVMLGNDGTNAINYGGSTVDDFKLYKSALSAANILTDYQNWSPSSPAPAGTFGQVTHQFHKLRKTSNGTIDPYGTLGGGVKVVVNGSFILDTQTDCTVTNCGSISEVLYYNKNGGTFVPVTNFVVPGQDVFFYGSTSDPDILTGAVACCLSGSLTAFAGATLFSAAAIPTFTLTQNASIVNRVVLRLGSGSVDGDVLCFKKYNQIGLALNTYTPSTGACVTAMSLQTGLGF